MIIRKQGRYALSDVEEKYYVPQEFVYLPKDIAAEWSGLGEKNTTKFILMVAGLSFLAYWLL